MPTPLRNFRIPDSLWNALTERAASEGTSATALVIRFCQQGLGLEPGSASSVTDETLDARIDSRLSSCIDSRLALIQEKLAALESALGEFNA